jgi:hypothetical protein
MRSLRLLTLLTVAAMLVASAATTRAAETSFSAEAVRGAFSGLTNDDGRSYDLNPGSIVVLTGSFTAPGAKEAVVRFIDNNQSHAAAAAELWLLRRDGSLKPVVMIDQADDIEARLIDPDGTGISAILLTASHFSTGGFITSYRSLVSLWGGEVKTIFSAAGNDFAFYAMYEEVGGKDKIVMHQIDYRENYGDSPAELIDTELSGAFVKTGNGDSGYEVVWRPVATTTWRLVVDKSGAVTGTEKIR